MFFPENKHPLGPVFFHQATEQLSLPHRCEGPCLGRTCRKSHWEEPEARAEFPCKPGGLVKVIFFFQESKDSSREFVCVLLKPTNQPTSKTKKHAFFGFRSWLASWLEVCALIQLRNLSPDPVEEHFAGKKSKPGNPNFLFAKFSRICIWNDNFSHLQCKTW